MRHPLYIAVVGSTFLLSACSADQNLDQSSKVGAIQQELEKTKQVNQVLGEQNVTLERQIAALKQSPPVAQKTSSDQADLPPQAKAGECYARVFEPPAYQNKLEQLIKAEASERVEIIPAQYGWDEQQVLVKQESERVEVIPATYKTVEETLVISEATERAETIPAVYEIVSDEVMVKPAYTTWKKGRGPIEKVDAATGEIMCLIEVPAEYKSVSKSILKTPAQTRTVAIPAEYKTVTKRVVDTPATTRLIKVPAEYTTVRVRKEIAPASEQRTPIPAQYQTVTKTEKISEGRLIWKPILCETNVTPGVVSNLQTALKVKGYDPGRLDGVIGAETMAAVTKYQQAQGLPSGQLTMETLKTLDINLTTGN